MKKFALITLAVATLAIAGCRQEVAHTPMKLGAPATDTAR